MCCRNIDAEELLAIRNGSLTYQQTVSKVENLLETAKNLAEKSTLPKEPDKAGIRRLCKEILRQHLNLKEETYAFRTQGS